MGDDESAAQSVRVRDPKALRALSHPLRIRLLGLLRLEGPSTSTLLAGRVGESSGATSYHLRELARFGFVAEALDRGTSRERWWQATARMTSWHAEDFDDVEVLDELTRHLLGMRQRLLSAWSDQAAELGPAWRSAGGLNDYALRLTRAQATDLSAELTAVLARWLDRHPAAAPAEGTELVGVLLDVLPLRRWPL